LFWNITRAFISARKGSDVKCGFILHGHIMRRWSTISRTTNSRRYSVQAGWISYSERIPLSPQLQTACNKYIRAAEALNF